MLKQLTHAQIWVTDQDEAPLSTQRSWGWSSART